MAYIRYGDTTLSLKNLTHAVWIGEGIVEAHTIDGGTSAFEGDIDPDSWHGAENVVQYGHVLVNLDNTNRVDWEDDGLGGALTVTYTNGLRSRHGCYRHVFDDPDHFGEPDTDTDEEDSDTD